MRYPRAKKQTKKKTQHKEKCFHFGVFFFRSFSTFLFLQTRQSLMPGWKLKDRTVVSSNHSNFSQTFPESFRFLLANLRQACTCAFLNSGTFQALQDVNPSQCCVSNSLLGDCVTANCLQIINKLLLCGFEMIHHLFKDHSHPMMQDLAWNSRLRAIDGVPSITIFHF